MNIKNCGRRNVQKHIEIKGSNKYVNLYISLKFGSLDKMRITSSEPKYNLVRSGKGYITSLGFKSKARPKRYKKERHAIENFSKKDLSNIIREFEKLSYKIYEKKRPKHEPTKSYFYLARRLVNFMMRAYALN